MPETQKTSVAFLGLGRMGSLMARRLIDAGHDVTVWNRTAERTAPLVEAGARAAQTACEAVSGVDLVVTMLSDPEAVKSTFFGQDGAAQGIESGALVIEMSTIGPIGIRELRERLPGGVRLVDGPVLGSLPQANSGELRVFLGGSAEDVKECEGLLGSLGTSVHVGGLGAGAALKLSVNLAFVTATVAVGEALDLAEEHGLDTDVALDALSLTPMGTLVERLRGRITSTEPTPTAFSLGLAEKDLALAIAEGTRKDGTVAGARTQLDAGRTAGLGDQDLSTIVRHLRRSVEQ